MNAGALDAAIAAMSQLPADAAHVPDAMLVSRMQQLVRIRAMADAALTEQLAAFDANAGARYDGQSSIQAWLRSRLRLGGQASDLLRVARQLPSLPRLRKAFRAGEITLEHAAAIAELAGKVGGEPVAEYEPILLDLARQAPPRILRIACAHLRQLLDPDGDADQAARQRRARYLSAGRTIDGMVHLQGLLDATAGDVVLTALSAATPAPAESEERTAGQRRADALTDICAGWLAGGDAPTSGGVRPQVQVTVSLQALQSGLRSAPTPAPHPSHCQDGRRHAYPRHQSPGNREDPRHREDPRPYQDPSHDRDSSHDRDPGHHQNPQHDRGIRRGRRNGTSRSRCGVALMSTVHAGRPARDPGDPTLDASRLMLGDVPVLADGQPVTPDDARRLACDASIIPVVLGSDSEPLDVGRRARLVPVGLRRALNLRDGGCRFAGCDRPSTWCDAHHIRHWADGGETSLDNTILLCGYHHTLIHEGWRLIGDPNQTVEFQRPDHTRLELTSAPRCRPPTRGP